MKHARAARPRSGSRRAARATRRASTCGTISMRAKTPALSAWSGFGTRIRHGVGAARRIDRVADRLHLGLDRRGESLDVDQRRIADAHQRELALGNRRPRFELAALLQHDARSSAAARARWCPRRRAAPRSSRRRAPSTSVRSSLCCASATASHGLRARRRAPPRAPSRAARSAAAAMMFCCCSSRARARSASIWRARRARVRARACAWRRRHLVGLAVDLEERGARLDAVAFVDEDAVDAALDLGADLALALGLERARRLDALEDRAAPHGDGVDLDLRFGGRALTRSLRRRCLGARAADRGAEREDREKRGDARRPAA